MGPRDGADGGIAAPIAGALAVAAALLLACLWTPAAWASASDRGNAQVAFTARGSVEQIQVTGANPGQGLRLIDRRGDVVDAERGGSLGGIVSRHVRPGGGYRVRQPGGAESASLRVLPRRSAPPDT